MGAPLTPEQKRALYRAVNEGCSIAEAARRAHMGYSTARALIGGHKGPGESLTREAANRAEAERASILGKPIPYNALGPRARQGWDDFEFFRRVYLGHLSLPWHVEAAQTVVAAMASGQKEFIVINAVPGSGKTTLLHDIGAWVTVRERSVRGVFGSRVHNNAKRMMNRLRRTLERTTPPKARQEDIDHGLGVDAHAALAVEYGLFRPLSGGDIWRADEFVVVQADDEPIEEKEPTWSAVGMDTGFLGNRYDLIFWDDLVDRTTVRTLEAVETQRAWWEDEAETRLEPRGALFLVGQRIASNDLYRHCLDKKVPLDEEQAEAVADLPEAEQQAALAEQPAFYRHIAYRAHYEERCHGAHRTDSPAYPAGCLLDPRRVPWREIVRIRSTKPRTYAVQYQQEDADPESVLVKKVWVSGGTDPDTNTFHPGCWDEGRGLCELPAGLIGPKFSLATVDPSPTKLWALQWWVFCPDAQNQLFLLDTVRRSMPGNELLDWNNNTQQFYGVMEDWQARSVDLGLPITHWVIEVNAAQRFLLSYDHVRRWLGHRPRHPVNLVPHQTTVRKLDDQYGVDMVRDWWATGRVRLPSRGEGRLAALKLVDEVTKYPSGYTDDQVMAHWFAVLHLPNIAVRTDNVVTLNRPSWITSVAATQRLAVGR
jgi:hypothetical protein